MDVRFEQVFQRRPALIGMVHLAALPGTPAFGGRLEAVREQALEEAQQLKAAGFDGLLIENMHDAPYLPRQVGPEITATMAVIGADIKRQTGLPCGVQVLAGANEAALAVALAAGLDFIRAEGFVFAHVADEGLLNSDAGSLLRYRRAIGADHILVLTDIRKKHAAHALTADLSLLDHARTAAFFRSDGIILTGSFTGEPPQPQDLQTLRPEVDLPLIVGSGVSLENITSFLPCADALIVGSALKRDGRWEQPLDPERIQALMKKVHQWREP